MIQRRRRQLQMFKGIFLPASEEKASSEKYFEKSPKLKSQVKLVLVCCRNIPPWKLFKRERQLQIFLINSMIR